MILDDGRRLPQGRAGFYLDAATDIYDKISKYQRPSATCHAEY